MGTNTQRNAAWYDPSDAKNVVIGAQDLRNGEIRGSEGWKQQEETEKHCKGNQNYGKQNHDGFHSLMRLDIAQSQTQKQQKKQK
ncbi:hypothetical protein ES703_121160 [subsurface metagenome]